MSQQAMRSEIAHNSGELCSEKTDGVPCRAPAIRRIVATGGRNGSVVVYRCGKHAARIIHQHDIFDATMNPQPKKVQA